MVKMSSARRGVRRVSLFSTVALSAFAAPAFAQNAADETASSGGLEEIIVTAERREQSLQDIPISATVLGADQLSERGVDNVADLQQVAPSVAINTNNRDTFVNIRGVGLALSAPTSSAGVAFYNDGALIPHPIFIGSSFFDVEAIEVLRGPQGTLTGQNSTGGAVFVRTPTPRFGEFSGYIEQTVGNYGQIRSAGAINAGFSDSVAIRLAAVHDERDSFTKNLFPSGRTPGNVNLDAARFSLALRSADDRLNVNLRAEYIDSRSDNIAVKRRNDTVSTDPFEIQEDAESFFNLRTTRLSAELRYDLTDSVQIRAISTYRDDWEEDFSDGDRTSTARPRPPANAVGRIAHSILSYQTFIHEVNLISTSKGPFTWVIGAFQLTEDSSFLNERDANNTVNFVSATTKQVGTIKNTSESLFGQASYRPIEQIELIAGGRYSWDTQEFDRSITLPPVFAEDTAKSSQFTGKVAANFHATDNAMLYVSYSKGYKAGGVNVTAGQPQFGPEQNFVLEGGIKAQLFDRHVRLNAAAFQSKYKDIQFTSLFNGFPLLQNAAEGESWGVEAELEARFGGLSLNGGVGYLDAKFSRDACLNNTNNAAGNRTFCPSSSPTTADDFVAKGTVLPFSPKWTVNAGVQYEIDFGGEVSLTPRVQWSHTGSQNVTPFPSVRTIVPGRDIFDARLSLDIRDRYRIELFASNFTNKLYIASQIQNSSSADGGIVYGAPRQVGIKATVKFGG
jgi:iron complex outermembrane recepter protein